MTKQQNEENNDYAEEPSTKHNPAELAFFGGFIIISSITSITIIAYKLLF